MKRALGAVYAIAVLDAVGIGLVLPILPRLLRELGHDDDLGWRFGAFIGLYALMQFLASPLLGSLSDRFGRKPVLIASLAGATVDYVFMTFAPTFTLLFLGRAIGGITAASAAVAAASVSDLVPEAERARRFAQLGACFGIGFIAGPVLGGVLGETSVRAPFMAAAVLNGANMLMAMLLLPETRHRGEALAPLVLSPFAPYRWLFRFRPLLGLMTAYGLVALVGQVGGTIWVLYGQDRFGWTPMTIGFSLAAFGIFHAGAQAFIAGPISERFGERRAALIGILADGTAYVLIAVTTDGRVAFLLMPLFCLGGIAAPALQALASRGGDAEQQGRIQGLLAGMVSLASIIGPVAISAIYFASRDHIPGLVWLIGAATYLLALPLILKEGAVTAHTKLKRSG